MDLDYYAVLGVGPEADAAAVDRAYRRLSRVHHPDRGGSHEVMQRLNEARDILTDAAARATYDAARAAPGDAGRQADAAADAARARAKAADYPRRWADFEQWLGGVRQDFVDTKFGAADLGNGVSFPAPTSCSGCVTVGLGVAAGVALAFFLMAKAEASGVRIKGLYCYMIGFGLPVLGCAWAAAQAHQWLARELGPGQAPAPPPAPEPAPEPPPTAVIPCRYCGQKLRVPDRGPELTINCPSCRGRDSYRPARP